MITSTGPSSSKERCMRREFRSQIVCEFSGGGSGKLAKVNILYYFLNSLKEKKSINFFFLM